AFKGDAKHVLAYFEGLKSCTSGEWDEAALLRLKAQLDADHQAEIVAPNGKTYTVTEAMIAVRQETTKVTAPVTARICLSGAGLAAVGVIDRVMVDLRFCYALSW
ncbi:hypothetical protein CAUPRSCDRAFT_12587, partial [Caulochytrium protostelioides]